RNTVERLGSAPGFGVRRQESGASTGDDDGGALRQRGRLDDRRPGTRRSTRLLREPLPVTAPATTPGSTTPFIPGSSPPASPPAPGRCRPSPGGSSTPASVCSTRASTSTSVAGCPVPSCSEVDN